MFVGWLSDRIGRKPLMMGGLALGALLFFPLFSALLQAANPALAAAAQASPVIVRANSNQCSFQFDPLGGNTFEATSCDIVKSSLARAGVSYRSEARPDEGPTQVEIGAQTLTAPEPASLAQAERKAAIAAFQTSLRTTIEAAGYPAAANPAAINRPFVVAILAGLLAISALCAGTLNVVLVELFPARIRYSALSFPQNFGNGWFGGFMPATAFAIVAATGDVFAGLWYPVIVAGATCIIGLIFLPETRGRPIR